MPISDVQGLEKTQKLVKSQNLELFLVCFDKKNRAWLHFRRAQIRETEIELDFMIKDFIGGQEATQNIA